MAPLKPAPALCLKVLPVHTSAVFSIDTPRCGVSVRTPSRYLVLARPVSLHGSILRGSILRGVILGALTVGFGLVLLLGHPLSATDAATLSRGRSVRAETLLPTQG
jgi:hypothetical protein